MNNEAMNNGYVRPQQNQVVGPDQFVHGFVPCQPILAYTSQPTSVKKKKTPSPETDIYLMSVDQVCNWIEKLGVSLNWDRKDWFAYKESFRQKEIDGSQLVALQINDFKKLNIVKKLGHKIAIVRAVKVLKDRPVNLIEIYKKRCDMYSYGKLSSSEKNEKQRSEPIPKPKNKFGRKKSKKSRKKWYLTHTSNKANEDGKLHESDSRSFTQKSGPEIQRNQKVAMSSNDDISSSILVGVRKKPGNLAACRSDQKEKKNAGIIYNANDMTKARDSKVVDAPVEEPKEITILTDSEDECSC